jgi:hypothetical protein
MAVEQLGEPGTTLDAGILRHRRAFVSFGIAIALLKIG